MTGNDSANKATAIEVVTISLQLKFLILPYLTRCLLKFYQFKELKGCIQHIRI